MMNLRNICYLLIVSCFTGCGSTQQGPAPIINAWDKPVSTQKIHQVQAGESLYSVAWRYGKDYRELAKTNDLKPPYSLLAGQKLHLSGTPQTAPQATLKINNPIANTKNTNTPVQIPALKTIPTKKITEPAAIVVNAENHTIGQWQWPISGKLIGNFGSSGGKGVDIAAKLSEPVHATAAGQVVYAGSSLRGYGQLVILKHNAEFLSAYAHNRKLLVKEGETVKAGQVIAEAGDTEADQVMLHFEMRHAGKPVDPMNYLPKP